MSTQSTQSTQIIKSLDWDQTKLILKTGLLAQQADGSVLCCMGDTHVLCTVVTKKKQSVDPGFMPLTVNYREMYFAAGKIPGGFIKKEGKQTDRELLISRLIDRGIRPLFDKSFRNETQIICTVISYDPRYDSDIVASIGASAALAISGIPIKKNIGYVRVGKEDNKFVINPNIHNKARKELDVIVAGSKDSILMIESSSNNIEHKEILSAIEFGHQNLKPVVKLIDELKLEVNKNIQISKTHDFSELSELIKNKFLNKISDALYSDSKKSRQDLLDCVYEEILTNFPVDEIRTEGVIKSIFFDLQSFIIRKNIISQDKRVDGRRLNEVRKISCDTSILPRSHGSSLFTRGETQVLVSATLGKSGDEQMVDDITGYNKESFMLQYSFPPYSVGEVSPLRSASRRDIGHGHLASNALKNLIDPNTSHVIRVVSEVTSCNGSSSMATICGTSLALMDAGIKIESHVAGIAMGLVIDDGKYKILSDILSNEDACGDMDFKVAGTSKGITALQMDIKVDGINIKILEETLLQAREGMNAILKVMNSTISSPKETRSIYAPNIDTIQIKKYQIRDLIGVGGKVINEISNTSRAVIDVSKQGLVTITADDESKLKHARTLIEKVVVEPVIGNIYEGKVVKIIDSGAFINYVGCKDGFLHISEVSNDTIDDLKDVIDEGDIIKVKVLAIDIRGRSKLTMLLDKEPTSTDKTSRPRGGGNNSSNKNQEVSRAPRYNSNTSKKYFD